MVENELTGHISGQAAEFNKIGQFRFLYLFKLRKESVFMLLH